MSIRLVPHWSQSQVHSHLILIILFHFYYVILKISGKKIENLFLETKVVICSLLWLQWKLPLFCWSFEILIRNILSKWNVFQCSDSIQKRGCGQILDDLSFFRCIGCLDGAVNYFYELIFVFVLFAGEKLKHNWISSLS